MPTDSAACHLRPLSRAFSPPGRACSLERSDEAREIAAAQIGVSWLPDDLWSRGKCGLKILQYQATGLPVIANPVGSHCEMIKTGETGFLPTSADEWVAALAELAESHRMRQKMGQLARSASSRITRFLPGPRRL